MHRWKGVLKDIHYVAKNAALFCFSIIKSLLFYHSNIPIIDANFDWLIWLNVLVHIDKSNAGAIKCLDSISVVLLYSNI